MAMDVHTATQYLTSNPDLIDYFSNNANDLGMTAQQYANFHYNTFGANEGRTPGAAAGYVSPDSYLAQADSWVNQQGQAGTGLNPSLVYPSGFNLDTAKAWQPLQPGGASTPTTPQQNTGLTLADLNSWWSQQQAAQQNGIGSNANSLGQLFPRTNWGNYQTSGRGGRYFDPTSGKYQGLGNLPQTQTASL